MTQGSVQPRDLIFLKGYGFVSSAKNMGKNIGKNISKNFSNKSSQKLLDHAKKSATDALKTSSKRVIQKEEEVTSDLIDNKIANGIRKVLKKLQQNNSETVTNEHDKEIHKEIYIFPEERQESIDNLIFNVIME